MLTISRLRRLARLGLCLAGCVTLACSGGTASVDGGRGGDTGALGGSGGASATGGGTGAGGSGSQGSGGAPLDAGPSGGSGGTSATGGRAGGGGSAGTSGSGGAAGGGGTRATGGTGGSGGKGGSGGARGPVACPTMSTAAATTTVTLDGNNVSAANVNGLTFKGFGVLSANGTSAVLMDYKSQHPDAYATLLQILFGGTNPVMTQVKIEMGNDRNNSTGPDPATMRLARPKRRTCGGIPAFSWPPTPRSSTPT